VSGRTTVSVAVFGVIGWAGLAWLAIQLYSTTPRTAGFDLELLLQAGRDVAGGRSPYDPAMVAGAAPVAERLFYSYPPVVAQLMALVAAIPSPVMFAAWAAAAVAGLAAIGVSLARRVAPAAPARDVALTLVALTPLIFPLAIGLLFGNLDVFFPLLYGALLLGVLPAPRGSGPAAPPAAGVAAGVAARGAGLTKLHPGTRGLWLLVRAARSDAVRRAVAAAIAAAGAILAASLLTGGVQPRLDYGAVVRAGGGADVVDPRNAGPAAQIALLVGGGGASAEALARTLQIPVTLGVLFLTAWAAIRLADPVESLAWAAAASLVVLPVTWYHYPSALIPYAVVAVLRSLGSARAGVRIRLTVTAAAVVAALAIVWLPLLYVATGLLLWAVRMSGRLALSGTRVGSGRDRVRAPAPG
jgi:hypothetical protein